MGFRRLRVVRVVPESTTVASIHLAADDGRPPPRPRPGQTELFGALPAITPGLVDVGRPAPHRPPGPAGTGPAVTFGRSGLTVPWRDGYGTVLESAEACDVPARWSCRTGVCHTCQTPVLSGSVRYGPDPLEPPEPGTALVCCARPETDLVLDL